MSDVVVTFREKRLTLWGWLRHAAIAFRPRPSLMRSGDRVVGVIVARPLKQFGRNWSQWRAVRFRR